MSRILIFEYLFDDEELEKDFEEFFFRYNLMALFTNEHRATPIKVTWSDAKSVLREGQKKTATQRKIDMGKDREMFLDFADVLTLASDNLSFEQAIFKIIQSAGSFSRLRNIIRKAIEFQKKVIEDRQFNFWNIVFYTKEIY